MLNLSTIKTPGVYIDEVSVLPPSVAGVETAIPAFIGYTEFQPVGARTVLPAAPAAPAASTIPPKPVRITSLREYEDLFGGAQAENDGLVLEILNYIDGNNPPNVLRTEVPVPVMDESSRSKHNMYYALSLYFANGGGPCYIVSIGTYSQDGATLNKDHFRDGIDALLNEDEPTLIVIPEAVNISLDSDYFGIYQRALDQAAKLKDRFVIIDVKQSLNTPNVVDTDITNFRTGLTNNRQYGAAYYPYLDTTIDYRVLIDATNPTVNFYDIKPDGSKVAQSAPLLSLETTNNIRYQQLLNVLSQVSLKMPPSPAVAGIYVQTDAARGVHKAPANVGITDIIGPAIKIDDEKHGNMNIDPKTGKSVNAIRTFTGRGTLVWGARTLEGNDNEWRYVNVRRFFNFVEESIKKATYRFVFEPNDANTWVSVRAMIENFLILQWRAGALQGAKPEQAFKVSVGLGQTMSPDDVLNGRLIVEIGLAVVRPAEFIILRFMHKLPE